VSLLQEESGYEEMVKKGKSTGKKRIKREEYFFFF